ncbi:NADH-quinone oxidoreductase subunit 5 family protein [Calidifontibacter terrae]
MNRFDAHTFALDLALQPSHLVVALPALGAVLIVLFVRRSNAAASFLATIAGLLGLVAAAWLTLQAARGGLRASVPTIGAFPGDATMRVPLRLAVDHLGVLVCCAVALVSLVVQIFARWYLYNDPRYPSFAATVGLFTAAMQLVVLSDDLLLTLVGWELMGWCSYLLIGHESERGKARRAAQKAFLVTRLADAPLVIGFVVLAVTAHTTRISSLLTFWAAHPTHSLVLALLCVVCGVAGKSALVPFQDWLPDAMEGPTPASALIHAATMVAAGTYLVARLHPLFDVTQFPLQVLAVLAGITTVVAALTAFLQHDLKKLLAWSTVSQMGLMLTGFAGLPRGTHPDIVVTHLLAHAGFKALLFLMIGWLAVLVGGTIVERMSGALETHRSTRRYVGIGLLALAGVPPLFGFVSKDLMIDEVLRGTADGQFSSYVATGALLIVVPLTAAYSMRAWLILTHRTVLQRHQEMDLIDDSRTIEDVDLLDMLVETEQVDEHGRPLDDEPEPDFEPDDQIVPRPHYSARLGLALLALASVVGGALVLTPWISVDYKHANFWIIGSGLLAMIAAGVLVRALAIGTTFGDPAARFPKGLRSFASRGGDVDRVYTAVVTRPVEALARLAAGADAALERGVRSLPELTGRLATAGGRVQNGAPSRGIVAVAAGVMILGLLGVTLS